MKKIVVGLMISLSMFASEIIIKPSSNSVDKTIHKIKTIVEKKGLHVFAIVDHQKNAQGVDMKMKASKLIIFGNPKMGTLLMQDDMSMGLDLPLKILVYSDKNSHTQMAYRNGSSFEASHTIVKKKILTKVNGALDKITTKAGQI